MTECDCRGPRGPARRTGRPGYCKVFPVALAVALLGLCGCQSTEFDLRAVPFPVMVSPILRVGDKAPGRISRLPYGHFEGEVHSEAASGASSYAQGSHYVGHSYYGQEWVDSMLSSIYNASGGRTDLVAIVDPLEAKHLVHMSVIGYSVKKLCIQGDLYLANDLASGGR